MTDDRNLNHESQDDDPDDEELKYGLWEDDINDELFGGLQGNDTGDFIEGESTFSQIELLIQEILTGDDPLQSIVHADTLLRDDTNQDQSDMQAIERLKKSINELRGQCADLEGLSSYVDFRLWEYNRSPKNDPQKALLQDALRSWAALRSQLHELGTSAPRHYVDRMESLRRTLQNHFPIKKANDSESAE